MSASFFVARDWLTDHITDPHIQIIDARMATPIQPLRDVRAEYLNSHLPGAVFFDIEMLSEKTGNLPHMMPNPEIFAAAMHEMGICHKKHLIIYDDGTLFSAPRAWWMLRNYGVKKLSILAGGLIEWQREMLVMESGDVAPQRSNFNTEYSPQAVSCLAEIREASLKKTAQIIDARPAARFNALEDEPRPGLRRGHIPGAINIPWYDVVENGQLKTTDELSKIFIRRGIDLGRPIIVSCGSGVTAAVIVLALTTLNAHNVSLYDGSWSEWGARNDLPIESAS